MKKNSSDNLPSLQFYPSDWLGDMNLRMCSVSTRGAWIDFLCLMHKSKKYGYLVQKVDGKWSNMCPKTIQKLTGMATKRIIIGIQELSKNGVLKRDENGLMYSKRLVKDHALRSVRKKAGKLGGNPNLLNQDVKQGCKQKATPSSSSSSSSSTSVKTDKQKITFNRQTWNFEGITQEAVDRWSKGYPNIPDIWAEIIKAGMWLESHPGEKRDDAFTFLIAWFRKAAKMPEEATDKPDSYFF